LGISTLCRGRLGASTLGWSLRIPALGGRLLIATLGRGGLGVTTLGGCLGIVTLGRGGLGAITLGGRLATAARCSCLTDTARTGSCPTSILSRQGFTQ
jgi:hypothetical protein